MDSAVALRISRSCGLGRCGGCRDICWNWWRFMRLYLLLPCGGLTQQGPTAHAFFPVVVGGP